MATFNLDGKNTYFARLNPETGKYEIIAPVHFPAVLHAVPKEDVEPVAFKLKIPSFTVTITSHLPYALFWRNVWQRGKTKPISIRPIPDGNPRDN